MRAGGAGRAAARAWSVCVPKSSILDVMPCAVVDAASALTPKGVKYVWVSTCAARSSPAPLAYLCLARSPRALSSCCWVCRPGLAPQAAALARASSQQPPAAGQRRVYAVPAAASTGLPT